MDFELSDDQRAFQQVAREFATHELAPYAADWDARTHFPRETIARAGEIGFCGLYASETFGAPESVYSGMGCPEIPASDLVQLLETPSM